MHKAAFRASEDRYVIEGLRSVSDSNPDTLRALFLRTDAADRAGRIIARTDCPIYVVTPEAFDAVADTANSQGILAVAQRPSHTAERLLRESFLVLTDGVADPGNMGTLLRTAEAAGAGGVLCGPGSVDVTNPKTVRAAMGSVSRMPVVRFTDGVAMIRALKEAGHVLAAADLTDSVDYRALPPVGRVTLITGSEANGISALFRSAADYRLRIPMAGGVESLNAAVATGILLYTLRERLTTDVGE